MSQINAQASTKQIGNYQYNERHCLGEGAYGKVYQGQNMKTNEIVAIKKLDLVMFERDQYLRNQIVSEIEILKKFNHPNIVKFIDLITTQRSLYIITEFCKDGDLKQLLLKKRLSETEVLEIMIQIVNGFKELIKIGVIHRDLKPANILNHEGIVKIADFGFAKYVDNYTSQLLRSCVGSPLYMAPQVLSRKSYSTKCDIWSIGVIYYEMLFHDVPWKGRDEQDLLKNIQIKPLVFKSTVPFSKFSEEFLRKALSVDENERLTWDQVFELFEGQEKQLSQTSPILKRIRFEGKVQEKEQEEVVQKEPTWMKQGSTKVSAIGSEQLQKNLKLFHYLRQEIAFRHFVCIELKTKYDTLKPYTRQPLALEEVIALLSSHVLSSSKQLLQNINDTCDAAEAILAKGTKWNIIGNLKKEHEFYDVFYNDYKDHLDRSELTAKLQQQDRFRDAYDSELNEQQVNALEEYLNSRSVLLSTDIADELKRRINETYIRDRNFEAGVLAEYLADLVITRRRVVRSQDVDYELIHSEKSLEEDLKKQLDRLTLKIKMAQ